MATAEENKETEDKKDELGEDDLVFDPKSGEYKPARISRKLYDQQKRAQTRQVLTAGGLGLAGELGQFIVRQSVFDDPAMKAQRAEQARLSAEIAKDPELLTEAEKQEFRTAALAPVQRQAEASQRRAEAILASTGRTGDIRSLLAAGEVAAGQAAQQGLRAEAALAKEDVRRIDAKEAADEKRRLQRDEISAMFLEQRNKLIREPIAALIGNTAKLAGTALAYAPAEDFSAEIAAAKKAGVSDEQLEKLVQLSQGPGAKRRVKKYMKEIGVDTEAKQPMEGETESELEMKRQLEAADEAIAATREEAGTPDDLEGVTPAEGDAVDITEMSEEEAKKAAGLEKPSVSNQYQEAFRVRPQLYSKLYRKRKDDGYAYGFKDGVWTVYQGKYTAQPVRKPGTDEPVTFTLEEAKNSTNPNVRELYDLAVEKGLTD